MPRGPRSPRTRDRAKARLWLLRALRETRLAGDPRRTALDLLRELEPTWRAAPEIERARLAAALADRLGLGPWLAEVVEATLSAWLELPADDPVTAALRRCGARLPTGAADRSSLMLPSAPSLLFASALDVAPTDADRREAWAVGQFATTKRILIDDESGAPLHFEPALPPGMRELHPPFAFEFGNRPAARALSGPWASRRDLAALAAFAVGGESLARLAERFNVARPVAWRAVLRAAELAGVDLGPVLARPEHKAGRPRKPAVSA